MTTKTQIISGIEKALTDANSVMAEWQLFDLFPDVPEAEIRTMLRFLFNAGRVHRATGQVPGRLLANGMRYTCDGWCTPAVGGISSAELTAIEHAAKTKILAGLVAADLIQSIDHWIYKKKIMVNDVPATRDDFAITLDMVEARVAAVFAALKDRRGGDFTKVLQSLDGLTVVHEAAAALENAIGNPG